MKQIFLYIKNYWLHLNKTLFIICVAFTATAIFINYQFGLNAKINVLEEPAQYGAWVTLFLFSFVFVYAAWMLIEKKNLFLNTRFVLLLLLAPLLFAWKMSVNFQFYFTADGTTNAYYNAVIYWPLKLIVITAALFVLWLCVDRDQPFYGFGTKQFNPLPYLILLVLMVPLIAAAATQPDFLAVYPKMKNISFLQGESNSSFYKLLYELSYGSDFFTIELFFRGFLVLAFVKYAGKDAILPMAVFYCTIHFGKPLGECISSYFGGIILGVITYNTKTIWGGLLVHVGIAWLMEIAGTLKL